MNLTRWAPFRKIAAAFHRYMSSPSRTPLSLDMHEQEWTPAANITEIESEFLIEAKLPEVTKEGIKVSLVDSTITSSAERKQAEKKVDVNVIYIKQASDVFFCKFLLPVNVDAKEISAATKDGLLQIHLPKMEHVRSKPTQINSK